MTEYITHPRKNGRTFAQLQFYNYLIDKGEAVAVVDKKQNVNFKGRRCDVGILDYDILTSPELERANRILDELLNKKEIDNENLDR